MSSFQLSASGCTVSGNYADKYESCNRVGGSTGTATGTWEFKWTLPSCISSIDWTRARFRALPTSACNSTSTAVQWGTVLNYSCVITSGFQNASGTWVASNTQTIDASSTSTGFTIQTPRQDTTLDPTQQYYFVITITRPQNASGYYGVITLDEEASIFLCTDSESLSPGVLSVNAATSTSSLRTLTSTAPSGCPKDITTTIETRFYGGGLVQSSTGLTASINLPQYVAWDLPYYSQAFYSNSAFNSWSDIIYLRYGSVPTLTSWSIVSGSAEKVGEDTIQGHANSSFTIRYNYNRYGSALEALHGSSSSNLSYSSPTISASSSTTTGYVDFTLTPKTFGSYTFYVLPNDNYGYGSRKTITVNVNNAPAATLTQSKSSVTIGESNTYTATRSAPVGTPSIAWYITDPNKVKYEVTGGLTNTYFTATKTDDLHYNVSYKVTGTYTVLIVVTSSSSETNSKAVDTSVTKVPISVIANVSPALGAIDDTEFTISYTSDAVYSKTTQWSVKNSSGAAATLNIVTGSLTDTSCTFTVPSVDTYTVGLTIGGDYYEYSNPSVGTFTTQDIFSDNSPLQDRFKIALLTDDETGNHQTILFRKGFTNGNAQFKDLKIMEELNKIGVIQFKAIHVEKLTTNQQNLFKENTPVILYHGLTPIFYGTISSISLDNTNSYDSRLSTYVYNIKAESCEKLLDVSLLDESGVYFGSVENIAKNIIPATHQGVIETGGPSIGLSVSNISRLIALNNLSDNSGWRYRGHPRIITSGSSSKYTSSNVVKITGITTGQTEDTLLLQMKNSDGSYGYVYGRVGSVSGDTYTLSEYNAYNAIPSSTNICYATLCRSWAIDFRSTFYLGDPALTYRINQYARGVNNVGNINDKFGIVSVYGVGPNKERISRSVNCSKDVSNSHIVHNATYITATKDTYIVNVQLYEQAVGATTGEYNRKYKLYVAGWNYDSTAKYWCYGYNTESGDRSYVTIGPTSTDAHYNINSVEQILTPSGDKQTLLTLTLQGDQEYIDGNILLHIGTSMCRGVYTLLDSSVISSGSAVYVGGTYLESQDYTLSGDILTITNMTSTRLVSQCAHLVGCLVYDSVQDVNSPRALYGNTSLTIQGPDGNVDSQLELLACRYFQFGSTYTDRGDLTVPLTKYEYIDLLDGNRSFGRPGSHLRLTHLNNIGTEIQNDYEILKYEMDADKFLTKVTYGMSDVTLMDRIYTITKNNKMVF